MDQTIVDITGIGSVKAGDVAVIIGRDGGEEITAYEIAEKAGTITNEIVSRMGERLFRIWRGGSAAAEASERGAAAGKIWSVRRYCRNDRDIV